jgi:hypothetical protein
MKNPIVNGTLTAFAAVALFAGACSKKEPAASTPSAEKKTASIHCEGANACKGLSGCKTAKNACKGHNTCKGQGFVETASVEECKSAGGTPATM